MITEEGLVRAVKPAVLSRKGNAVFMVGPGNVYFNRGGEVRTILEVEPNQVEALEAAFMLETRTEFDHRSPARYYDHGSDESFAEAIRRRLS